MITRLRVFFKNFWSEMTKIRGFKQNPLFCLHNKKKTETYFFVAAVFLLGLICFGNSNFASLNNRLRSSDIVFFNSFFNDNENQGKGSGILFFGQNEALALETPDLKIIQENCVCGVSTPSVVTTKVLGDIFGESVQGKKDIVEYVVQPGDTVASIAATNDVSTNTILWANDLSKGSTLKVGQTIIILPVSGLVHVVKSGDTISQIAKKYKADAAEIISFNELSGEADIYIGDILVVPNGTMPSTSTSISTQAPVADSFFIYPTEGKITQGVHWFNAIDVANKCGTPVYAAASGTVQRVMYGYNFGGGNYITILHSGGITTYYGHLMTIFVKPGDAVSVGDRIALMGGGAGMAGAGLSTGCHLHFDVRGAKNPLSKYYLGTQLKYTK